MTLLTLPAMSALHCPFSIIAVLDYYLFSIEPETPQATGPLDPDAARWANAICEAFIPATFLLATANRPAPCDKACHDASPTISASDVTHNCVVSTRGGARLTSLRACPRRFRSLFVHYHWYWPECKSKGRREKQGWATNRQDPHTW
jgi:hypothetical protein